MSAHPVIELRCDAPGCTAAVTTGQRRVSDARAEAARAGRWTAETKFSSRGGVISTRDYCPDHGPGAERP